jgi:hypothetical protein
MDFREQWKKCSTGYEKSENKVAQENTQATQDELPCNESPEVLFSQ